MKGCGLLKKSVQKEFKIGDIFFMNFSGEGSEQSGWRPGLVFQNNIGNKNSPNIIALPLTSSVKKSQQPTHVLIHASNSGLQKDSMVLCENPERMSKKRIGNYITSLSKEQMRRVAIASLLATSAISFIEPEELFDLRLKAISLNATTVA